MVAAIRKAGYDVQPETFDLSVEGMTCGFCAAGGKGAWWGAGVVSALVNLATERATIRVLDKSPALTAAIDGKLAALIAVADPIKATSPAAIAALHGLGLKVVMVTGDNRRTADATAAELGIDEVVAEVLPEAKVTWKALRQGGRKVAFVGDAPALAEADVGLAVGTGTDEAIETAEVVLTGGDLAGVVRTFGISRATMRNIGQKLFWAFAYNVALIPVAAGALYPVNGTLLSPMLGARALAMSSVFVLSNALRLKRFGRSQAAPPVNP